MSTKFKRKKCPHCGKDALYKEKINKKQRRYRYRCINCHHTTLCQTHIPKNKIKILNNILNLIEMCNDKEKHDDIKNLNFSQKEFLTPDNIYNLEVTYNKEAYKHKDAIGIVLYYTKEKLEMMSLSEHREHFYLYTRLDPDDGYNEKQKYKGENLSNMSYDEVNRFFKNIENTNYYEGIYEDYDEYNDEGIDK